MPNKQQWKIIKLRLTEVMEVIKRLNPITAERVAEFWEFIKRSWKSIAIILPVLLLLYYLIGSWATNNIDKTPLAEASKPAGGLAVADSVAKLISREVDDHMWTPNLPVIFPGYVLDNMPQFQRGIIKALKNTTVVLSQSYDSAELSKAAELLKYPADIWLLSKTENLSLAPSSGAQYRKARKALQRFNEQKLEPRKSADEILLKLLMVINRDTGKIMTKLETEVREHSTDWFDNAADNVFYQSQGQMYAYYIVLKAMAVDFKSQILNADQYENWTILTKTLEDGLALSPTIVRNGEADSVFAPNHLLILGGYAAKARYQLNLIINAVQNSRLGNNHDN